MGTDLSQWRFSVGMFNLKSVRKKYCGYKANISITSTIGNNLNLSFAWMPFKILSGILLVFIYSLIIITSLSTCLIVYPFFDFCCIVLPTFFPKHENSFFSYLLQAFIYINIFPYYLSASIKYSLSLFNSHLPDKVKNVAFYLFVLQSLLLISGTVEVNPGPNNTKEKKLSFAVWNLDSLPARDFARIPLIEAFQNTYDFDMLGVCESMLNSTISNEDIFIDGFSPDPFRADKNLNIRNGGVCLYFKEHLSIKQRFDLQILPETIVAEIKMNKKKVFLVLSYCHPNMSNDESSEYMNLLEKINESIRKENSTVSILCGDFNAKCPLFWEGDYENNMGRLFNDFLISNNLDQLINEPTHIRDDGSQSCIDLICTDQPFFSLIPEYYHHLTLTPSIILFMVH